MKKFTLVLILAILVLTSCKKSWMCECETSTTEGTQSALLSIPGQTKSNAETMCDDYGTTLQEAYSSEPGLQASTSCGLQ